MIPAWPGFQSRLVFNLITGLESIKTIDSLYDSVSGHTSQGSVNTLKVTMKATPICQSGHEQHHKVYVQTALRATVAQPFISKCQCGDKARHFFFSLVSRNFDFVFKKWRRSARCDGENHN